MALFKRDNVWWITITHKGKRIRTSTNVTDKRTAERIHHKIMTQVAEGKWLDTLPGSQKTLSDLLEKYMKVHTLHTKSPSSQIRDYYNSKHLLRILGNPVLKNITKKDIARYKNQRLEEGAAPATVVKELNLLGHAFNLAIDEWEWIELNPVSRVAKPKIIERDERWLSFDEEERLLAICPNWLKEIIIFAVNTGFRRDEILSLTWTRVDLFRKTVIFQVSTQKNRRRDSLPLNQAAVDILKERAKVRNIKTPLVFYSEVGTKISGNNVRRAFLNACKRAEITGLRFHDLRHTFATRLVQAGVDIYTVQKLGRWKTISMVMRYAHHQTESLRAGVESLDKLPTKKVTIWSQSQNSQTPVGRKLLELFEKGD